MNTSQNDPNKPDEDTVDDLTRFLDEDFGTDEVDLFEFTSGEEESPLTQLKTIILGLDWEITDEALQDLADEIEHIRNLEQFQHDKVSQVYAQALDKIGNYLLTEGASSHPNAIKLLMTLFYDFEKITSSEHITGAEITALLKSDVRKFKILQYQIGQKHGSTDSGATAVATAELPLTEHETLLDIHAALLELDWEVTDKGLKQMADQLAVLKEQFEDNRYIQIVIRGLNTLNSYIDEERARAHPEAFTLLHHFFEALETLVDDKDLDEDKTQKVLINCVNRLNNLKALITQTPQELDDDAITPVSEADEEDELTTQESVDVSPTEEKAETTVEEQIAAQRLAATSPSTEKDEDEYEDVLDVVLPVDGSGEVAPALFDSDEEGGFAEPTEEEAPPEELEEKLQFFFGDDGDVPAPPPEQEIVAEVPEDTAETTVEEQIAAQRLAAASPSTEKDDDEYEDELDVVLPVDGSGEVAPALFDSDEEGGFAEPTEEEEAPPEELEEKLQFFFGDDEGVPPPPPEQEIVDEPVADEVALAPPEEDEYEDKLDVELPVDDSGEVAPALFDSEEESGFGASEEEAEAPPEELEENLHSFFGDDEEAFAPEAVEEAAASKKAEDDVLAATALKEKEDDDEMLSVAPALAGETDEGGLFTDEETVEPPPEGLEEKLEFFFGEDQPSEPETAETETPVAEEAPEALFDESTEIETPVAEETPEALFDEDTEIETPAAEETPEALFEEDDEEELLLTPALAADEDFLETSPVETLQTISTPEEFNTAIEKLRNEFQEREQSLLDEIASLKQEIESLRS